MHKLLLVLLAPLCVILALKPVFGSDGRDGGIVVLPAAVTNFDGSRGTIATYRFEAGEDVRLQLPTELVKSIAVVEVEGVVISSAAVSGRVFVVSSEEIACMQSSGVQAFTVTLVGLRMHSLILAFTLHTDGSVTLTVS